VNAVTTNLVEILARPPPLVPFLLIPLCYAASPNALFCSQLNLLYVIAPVLEEKQELLELHFKEIIVRIACDLEHIEELSV
jgi:hypothetical protein